MTDAIKMRGEGKHPAEQWRHIVRPEKNKEVDAKSVIKKLVDEGGLVLK